MANENYFAAFFKPLEAFKEMPNVPAFDSSQLIEQSKKNFEAAQQAQQILAEATQSFFQRQFEIAQANAEGALQLVKEIASSKDAKDSAAKQATYARNAVEKAANDASELSEIASKASTKATEIVSKQVTENFEQATKAAAKPAKKAA